MISIYEECQQNGDNEIHDDYVYIGQTSSGEIEIPLTGKQIKSICTMGENDLAVDAVCSDPTVKECIGKHSDEKIRKVLEEYGNWSEEELNNPKANNRRLVWSLAWNIFDSDNPNDYLAIDEMQS